jgi:predicted nucleic acid-binding protein
MTVVVDASALVAALTDRGSRGAWAREIVEAGPLAAPRLARAEVANALRRLEATARLTRLEATASHNDLLALPLALFPYSPFAPRVWALRDNLTIYDAWYVALAEAIGAPLATLDRRLQGAPGPACDFLTFS